MTDSAGVPFAGRDLPAHPFAGDEGACPASLAQALADLASGASGRDDAEQRLISVLRETRLLVGVVAAPVPEEALGAGVADARSEMATITLTAPDGRSALPVFSSVAALAAWRPDARPMPVNSADAARSAVQEGCEVMVLDLGAAEVTLRGSMVWALAMGHEWAPAHADEHVARAFAAACAPEEAVAWHDLRPGREGGVLVELGLVPGLGQDEVMAIARRVAERVAADGEARARVDAMEIGLRKA